MKTKKLWSLILLLFISFSWAKPQGTESSGARLNIIPMPQGIQAASGHFTVDKKTQVICNNKELKDIISKFKSDFDISTEPLVLENESQSTLFQKDIRNSISFFIEEGLVEEAYKIEIRPDRIICSASDKAGIFYAIQSLIQLSEKNNGSTTFNCVKINDFPAYPWRGLMLDAARHFIEKEAVKQYLDIMALLKMNRFHWHLTDEDGWRIEIKKYPLLTSVGAWGNWSDKTAAPKFYTQEDVKEIVEYARQRNIMVIPEIDMPGHAAAATKAYPEVSGGGEDRWEGFTFHPAREYTYEFLDNILSEVAELFPSPYIHIGGDEVHFGNQSWKTDSLMQNLIKEKNLGDEIGLEHYFVRRICDIINSKGKIMMGWDEIINTGVSPDKTIVMWWRHDKPELLTEALNKNFDVILTPRIPCYFDFVQDESHKIGRRWGQDFNRLETVYTFPESIETMFEKNENQILGLQANVWTERIKDKKRLDFMTFPRLLAVAEDGWSRASIKDFGNFENRVKKFLKYLDTLGIYYFNPFDKESTPEPWGPQKQDVIAEG